MKVQLKLIVAFLIVALLVGLTALYVNRLVSQSTANIENLNNMFILIIVFIVLFGISISYTITQPLIKLRDATNEIAKGNFDVEIPIKSKDEIGELAVRFDKMRQSIEAVMRVYEEQERKKRR